MKVAIVYDRINKWGGAERVLLSLHEMYPNATLYTSLYDKKKASWANVFPEIHTSFLQKIPFAKDKHELLGTFMPLAFESISLGGEFDKYDLVISVSSEAAMGIITKPDTRHVHICLTPTRYLWSHFDEYFSGSFLKKIVRVLSGPFVNYLKSWDKQASSRPDLIIAISTEVKRRIKKYYKRSSVLIFPGFSLDSNKKKNRISQDKKKDYYLIVSRLVGYKKVNLALNLFKKLKDKKLIVVGTGAREKEYKIRFGGLKNIEFVGNVSDEKLSGLYKNATALIMPQEEDFGLVAIEAMSFGTPVIAFKKGGSVDTVNEKTGVFFEKQDEESLEKAVKKLENISLNSDTIIAHAEKFSKEKFKQNLQREIAKIF